MPAPRLASAPTTAAAADTELAARIARKDQAAFETLMRRHNGKLFRVARAILKDDGEAEDALQDAYLGSISTPASSPNRGRPVPTSKRSPTR